MMQPFVFYPKEIVKDLFKVSFSEKESVIRWEEEATYAFFRDFLDECEGMLYYNFIKQIIITVFICRRRVGLQS